MDPMSWIQVGLMVVGGASAVYKMFPKKWQGEDANVVVGFLDRVVNAFALNPTQKNARKDGIVVKDNGLGKVSGV